jgi:multiple sugar transport system permease protein
VVSGLIFLSYLVPPSILFCRSPPWCSSTAVRLADGVDPDLPDHPDPVLDLAVDGYFKTIPFELEECALIDGASRWRI